MARVSKEKQKETLKRMKERRAEDSIHLRSIVGAKIKWAEDEYKKGKDYIEKTEKQIEIVKQKLLRLEGCISGLKQVIIESEPKKEEPKDDKTNN